MKKIKNDYLSSLLIILEQEFPKSNISKYIYKINLKNDYDGNTVFGLDKLFHDLYIYYKPNQIDLEKLNNIANNDLNKVLSLVRNSILFKNILDLNGAMSLCHKRANKLIKACSATSFFAGIVPIPFSDIYSISSIQLFLFTSILVLYGYKINKVEIENTLKSLGLSSFSAIIGYSIGNLLMLIPGLGTLIGGLIKGGVASAATYNIGKICIDYCEKNFIKDNAFDFYKNLAYNYNRAVNDLEKHSQSCTK